MSEALSPVKDANDGHWKLAVCGGCGDCCGDDENGLMKRFLRLRQERGLKVENRLAKTEKKIKLRSTYY